uniref:Uncharacterized protein n=1 Tax=Chromera velia CCMP2878 TaxID=1169474 RepID=A0A0K6SB18_9ALVE|eukprot:Cvel_12237.t1-p1 / transcript=Cvel_12237.t1 / gene=Cvel_12237 / organism=Chromera_velia_CCMP2878 / gene_product=Serine/threonine-protein phosphatase 6 regulatory, putative / transcript_product=Serine/threonine-protein phosphatase 6 regulatory, putative / location=Cvel_scaffold792:49606-60032(-) / protein_length=844 / sequence_SO=supercontig / SO=protein_coding / is_pseudo=false
MWAQKLRRCSFFPFCLILLTVTRDGEGFRLSVSDPESIRREKRRKEHTVLSQLSIDEENLQQIQTAPPIVPLTGLPGEEEASPRIPDADKLPDFSPTGHKYTNREKFLLRWDSTLFDESTVGSEDENTIVGRKPWHWEFTIRSVLPQTYFGDSVRPEEGDLDNPESEYYLPRVVEEPLNEATVRQDYKRVEWYVTEKGKSPNSVDKSGRRPLDHAVELGDFKLVDLLLNLGADPNTRSAPDHGISPLCRALNHREYEIADRLLEGGASPKMKDTFGWDALFVAVSLGQEEYVERFLRDKCNPNSRDDIGATPLITACNFAQMLWCEAMPDKKAVRKDPSLGLWGKSWYEFVTEEKTAKFFRIVQMLLDAGADVNLSVDFGFSPLHVAVQNNFTEAVGALLERGAKVNAMNKADESPLIFACMRDFTQPMGNRSALQTALTWKSDDTALLLIERGADIHRLDPLDNATTLILACGGNTQGQLNVTTHTCPKCIDALVDRGIDVNQENSWGLTPLLMLCTEDTAKFESAKKLVEAGARIDVVDRFEEVVFNDKDCRVFFNLAPSVDLMKEWDKADRLRVGCGLNVRESCLTAAARSGLHQVVDYLLERGADLEHRDLYGRGCVHWAAMMNDDLTMNVLVKYKPKHFNDKCFHGYTPMFYARSMRNREVIQILQDKFGVEPSELFVFSAIRRFGDPETYDAIDKGEWPDWVKERGGIAEVMKKDFLPRYEMDSPWEDEVKKRGEMRQKQIEILRVKQRKELAEGGDDGAVDPRRLVAQSLKRSAAPVRGFFNPIKFVDPLEKDDDKRVDVGDGTEITNEERYAILDSFKDMKPDRKLWHKWADEEDD